MKLLGYMVFMLLFGSVDNGDGGSSRSWLSNEKKVPAILRTMST